MSKHEAICESTYLFIILDTISDYTDKFSIERDINRLLLQRVPYFPAIDNLECFSSWQWLHHAKVLDLLGFIQG